jgi:peptide/nickel transport system permease protein
MFQWWRKLRRRHLALGISVFLLLLVAGTGILAPLIAPYDPHKGTLADQKLPPAWIGERTTTKKVVEFPEPGLSHRQISISRAKRIDPNATLGGEVAVVLREGGNSRYLLGTDDLGRDILSRIIYGARISLIIAAVTLGIGGAIGTGLGLIAGYFGGLVDELLMRIVDIFLALPLVLVALVLVVAVGQSFFITTMVLVLFIWVRFARQIRGEVLQLKTMDYVSLAKVAGASTPRILFIHLFPGVINTLIVVATLQVSIVILVESTLSFLGAGVPPPTPAWGSMVADGRDFLADAWWISTMPGVAILLTVLSLNLFGDWLRDRLDPKLRQLN